MPVIDAPIDWLPEAAARLLAERIRLYWLARGYDVTTRLELAHVASSGRAFYCVRSDMVGGLPCRRAERMAA